MCVIYIMVQMGSDYKPNQLDWWYVDEIIHSMQQTAFKHTNVEVFIKQKGYTKLSNVIHLNTLTIKKPERKHTQ